MINDIQRGQEGRRTTIIQPRSHFAVETRYGPITIIETISPEDEMYRWRMLLLQANSMKNSAPFPGFNDLKF